MLLTVLPGFVISDSHATGVEVPRWRVKEPEWVMVAGAGAIRWDAGVPALRWKFW